MNKVLILIAISISLSFQSCMMVYIADPLKKGHAQESIATEPLAADLSCVNVNPSTGVYTVDPHGCVGNAYKASCDCVMIAGSYGHGSSTWNDEYEEWLNGDSDESPDKFNDIDGCGYHDSIRAAKDVRVM
mgnify:CR=1 FL=1